MLWTSSWTRDSITTFPNFSHPCLIFVIFSPNWQFLVWFFSSQKCANHDKTDFVTKVRKFQQTSFKLNSINCTNICEEIFHITHIPDMEKFQISPNLWGGEIWNHITCGHIFDVSTSVMWRNLKLPQMWKNFRCLTICHVEKSQISPIIPCIWSFSTWHLFILVELVTNTRYNLTKRRHCITSSITWSRDSMTGSIT